MRTLTFRGIRGSMPVAGDHHRRYGGHTTCIDIPVGSHEYMLFDCGTGIRGFQSALPEAPDDGFDFWIFLTHYHWDHVQGLPFFRPLYEAKNRIHFYGHTWEGRDVQSLIGGTFSPPWFPVSLDETAATKSFHDIHQQHEVKVADLVVTADTLHHPQGVTAYRIASGDRVIAIATDVETGDPESDAALIELAEGADVLIHDAQYTPDEYEGLYTGWGHSTWEHAVENALRANVKRLILVSHEPDRTDEDIDQMLRLARSHFPLVDAAYEGMTIQI